MHPLTPDFAITPVSARRPQFGYEPAADALPPVVSVIVPYYNTGLMFAETARSVQLQSLQHWEMLIVNDGSDDALAIQVLDGYREADPRIRVIDLGSNRGLPGARNAGIQEAQGKYLFFLDSDDLVEPTALEKMAWCLDSYPEYAFCKGFTVWFGARELMNTSRFEAGDLFLQRNVVTILAMIRQEVALDVGGFDESLVAGLEDWDFWLKCADHGYWGHTIPEPFDWFRRRQEHSDRWASWTAGGVKEMRQKLRKRYPGLYARGVPKVVPHPSLSYGSLRHDEPFANLLSKNKTRVLLIIPWMAMGGADKFNLDVVRLLNQRGYEFSIATMLPTNYAWHREFAKLTPEIFILPNFLRQNDYGRFLCYLVRSRQIDIVMVTNSQLGYNLLPYLRSRCPDATYVDYSHMEEEHWNSGGHPRSGVAYQEQLDLNLVASQHLKEWMVERGANAERIEVCTVNVDTKAFTPDPELREQARTDLGIAADTPVLLYACRLTEQKQPKVFAAVMKELKGRGVPFIALVAGDGEDRKWLVRYLRRNRLRDNVRILGAVSHDRMQDLYAASDIFLLPSKMEGISITIYEAMSMGIVPVGAAVGGQKELVTPECGYMLESGTIEEQIQGYADILEELIQAPEKRATMGQAAQDRVRAHFDLAQMGERMDTLLRQAQQLHKTQPRARTQIGLSLEHATLALEHEGLLQWSGGLAKYEKLDSTLKRGLGRITPWQERANRFVFAPVRRLFQTLVAIPARKVKDEIWIVGHRVKVRLLRLDEDE